MTTSDRPTPQGFPIGLTIAVVISLAILLALGAWQMKRLAWKEDLLGRIAALQTAAPQPLSEALARAAAGENVDFTRVATTCAGLATAPYVELYALRDGAAGERIISKCAVEGAPYASILIDRGYVADTVSARPVVDAGDTKPVAMVGVLRAPDKRNFAAPADDPGKRRFFTRDVAAIAGVLGAPAPAPVFLMAETSSNPEWQALVPAPTPTEIANRHLEYALTWFGLAATLACVYAAMLWRRLRPAAPKV